MKFNGHPLNNGFFHIHYGTAYCNETCRMFLQEGWATVEVSTNMLAAEGLFKSHSRLFARVEPNRKFRTSLGLR